jgi:hypothetical protein
MQLGGDVDSRFGAGVELGAFKIRRSWLFESTL